MPFEQKIKDENASILNRILSIKDSLIAKSACGTMLSDSNKGLEVSVLGINYKFIMANGEVKVSAKDPLNREEDASKLLTYIFNAMKRILEGKLAKTKGKLISLAQLPGGQTARLYEKRIANFLAVEMDGAKLEEVEAAVVKIGGCVVEHLNATWSFEVTMLNSVRIRGVYWQGEEEIPSGAASLLGEKVKEAEVPLEELITVIEITVNRLVLFYRKATGRKPKLFHSLYF